MVSYHPLPQTTLSSTWKIASFLESRRARQVSVNDVNWGSTKALIQKDQRPGHLTILFLAYCWGLEGLACYKLQIRKVGMPFCPSSLTISNLIRFLGILSRACMLGNNGSTIVLLTAYCRCFHSLIPLKGCTQN